jgi:biotin synthase-like enzyme
VCKYCSIGRNYQADAVKKKSYHLVEAIQAAVADPIRPAKHVLLGGGTPAGDDMGARLASELCRLIKSNFPGLSVYVMIAAPLEDGYIDELYDAGVDELGINLEFWSERAWHEFIPGKERRIGRKRYLEAIEYSAEVFGPVRARSIVIAGLEPAVETLAAVDFLSSVNVMPIISPFRPLQGTQLERRRGFEPIQYEELFLAASEIVSCRRLPLGPTCICCQNNTLTLPYGPAYCYY